MAEFPGMAGILAEVPARKAGQESGNSEDVLFNRRSSNTLAENGVTGSKVKGADGQLELGASGILGGRVFKEEVVGPIHIVAETEVVELAGTKRPSG